MKWNTKFILCLLCLLLLTSCINAKELERMYYVHAIGIDYVDDHFEVFAQILNISMVAKEAGQIGDTRDAHVGKASGKTVDTAFHNLYKSTSQRIYWGHLSAIVFSEAALEEDYQTTIDLFTRFNEVKYTPWIFSTNSPIDQLLGTFPILEATPVLGTIGDPMDSYRQSSFVLPIRMHKFVADLNEPGKSAIIPNLTIDKNSWFNGEQREDSLHTDGLSIIINQNYKGKLTNLDIVGRRWMENETVRSPIILNYKDEPVVVVMMEDPTVKITPLIKGNEATFKLDVEVGGAVLEMKQKVSMEFIKSEAQNVIEGEIRKTFEKGVEIKADVYQLSYELFKRDPKKWKQLTNGEELNLKENTLESINVKVKIKSAGKTKLDPFL